MKHSANIHSSNRSEMIARSPKKIIVNRGELSIKEISMVVCNHFQISCDKIGDNTRKREIVQSRQVAMYFARQFTKMSFSEIGQQLGNRDHSTSLHSCKVVQDLFITDKVFRNDVQTIEKKLLNYINN